VRYYDVIRPRDPQGKLMQRFIAELSTSIEKSEFERAWRIDESAPGQEPSVEFAFAGRRVSAVVHSDLSNQWPSAGFHERFSATIRRLNILCNIRWL
jgi:hypothetical protein